jgi:hypothetical protein
MKVVSKSIVQNHAGVVLALLASFAAISPSASANHSTVKPAVQPASVIAHLPLGGSPASQMFLGERGGTQYLYLGQTSKDGVMIVDVTKPSQPSVVKRMAWPNEASSGKLQMIGGGLALTEAPDTATVPRPETLTVLDLSDPTNPRTILSLSGVTSTLTDDARNLIYIINNDGLWIVKRLPEQASSSEHRGCLSQDAFNEFASCQ